MADLFPLTACMIHPFIMIKMKYSDFLVYSIGLCFISILVIIIGILTK